jgi:hypothetical protein
VNVHACYREFAGASAERPDVMQMLGLMGQRYFSRPQPHAGATR